MNTESIYLRVMFNSISNENGVTRFYFARFPSVGDFITTENDRYKIKAIDHIVSKDSKEKPEVLLILEVAR